MSKFSGQNLEEMRECIKEIHELLAEESKNKAFLDECLFRVRELEERIQYHRKLFLTPQQKNRKQSL